MPKQYYTYLYIDPKYNTAIYVGKGTKKRATSHLDSQRRSRLSNVLKKRIKEGFKVAPIIHNEVDETTALQMEIFWIEFYGRADLGTGTLFNLTNGGEGASGSKRNPASIRRAAEKNRGRKHTDEARARMSASQKGKTASQETRLKMRDASGGRWNSPETIQKKRDSANAYYARKRAESCVNNS